jgi:ABC-type glycerol-3-phosphate transport system permease component
LTYEQIFLFALIAVLPFLHTIARSFSAEAPITRGEVYLWPVSLTFDAYQRLIIGGAFWHAESLQQLSDAHGRRCRRRRGRRVGTAR